MYFYSLFVPKSVKQANRLLDDLETLAAMDAQCMTSLDIAAVTGKPHKDVLKAIRAMEPVFSLTKEETLYVATKFNDQARARLVLRWRQLEEGLPQPLRRREDQKLLAR